MIQMLNETTFATVAKGTEYRLRLDPMGRWELTSQRVALRAARMGGRVRHFHSLTDVGSAVKAFRGIDVFVAA